MPSNNGPLAFDSAHDAVWIVDKKQRVRQANTAAEKLFDRSIAKMIGRPCCEVVHGKAHPAPDCPFLRAQESLCRETLETQVGARRLEITAEPLLDAAGHFAGAVHVVKDVTVSRRVEEKALDLAELLDYVPSSVMLYRFDGRILYANRRALEMHGYTRDELLALSVSQLLAPEDAALVGSRMQGIRDKGEASFEVSHLRKDGTTVPLDVHARIVSRADGDVVLGVATDITERKRAEATLLESEQRMSSIYDTVGDVIFCLEVETEGQYRFVSVNRSFCRVTGLRQQQILGKKVNDVIPEPSLSMVLGKYREAIEAKTIVRWEETSDYPAGRLTGEVSVAPAIDSQGRCTHLVGSVHDITKRKGTEEALQRSEDKYRELVENLNDVVYSVRLDGLTTYVSPAIQGVLGYAPTDLLNTSFWRLIHPADLGLVRQAIEDIVRGRLHPSEYRLRAKSGEVRWVRTSSRPIRERERIVGLQGVLTDITERKRAEEALRNSEEHFRALIEHSHDAVTLLAADGTVLYDSSSISRVLGYGPGERIGRKVFEFVHPDERESMARGFARFVEQPGAVAPSEVRFLHKDGTLRHVEGVRTNLLHEPAVSAVVVNFRDITERKQAEETLRKMELEYRTLAENSPDLIARFDTRARHLYVNSAAARMGKLSARGYLGLTIAESGVPEPVATTWEQRIEQVLDSGTMVDVVDSFPTPEGIRWFHTRFVPELNSEGSIRSVLSVARDITERKRAEEEKSRLEEQLQQALKMESVGRLAGGVAHDFNNALAVILGHVEFAVGQVDPAQPLHADLEEIRKAASRAADLTRQLLSFARKQTVALKVLDLNGTVSDMLTMLQRLIGENIRLIWQPQADLWPLKVDPSQLGQILANLCANARDAITDVGTITIATRNRALDAEYCAGRPGFVPGEYVLIAVGDDGCGMDKETLAHIFEPFFTTKGVGKGTGLGLATVYGAVKQNGGFIEVDSGPARGTTVTIYLPRHVGEEGPARMEGVAGQLKRGQETILLVEDELTVLETTRRMLETRGYTVLSASTPADAIRLAKEHAGGIDLLMSDVIMPEMNGRDLAENLLSLYPRLKRLFTSGYTGDVIAHHGVVDEGVSFIQKPFSSDSLAAKVRGVLDTE